MSCECECVRIGRGTVQYAKWNSGGVRAFCHRRISSVKWTKCGQKDRNTKPTIFNAIYRLELESIHTRRGASLVYVPGRSTPTLHYIRINLFRKAFEVFCRNCFFFFIFVCRAQRSWVSQVNKCDVYDIFRMRQRQCRLRFLLHIITLSSIHLLFVALYVNASSSSRRMWNGIEKRDWWRSARFCFEKKMQTTMWATATRRDPGKRRDKVQLQRNRRNFPCDWPLRKNIMLFLFVKVGRQKFIIRVERVPTHRALETQTNSILKKVKFWSHF